MDVPLVSAHAHCQSRDQFLVLLSAPAPFGLPQQPVGQSDNFVGLVEAVVFIGVLDGVARDAAFGVESENEEPAKSILLILVEYRLLAT